MTTMLQPRAWLRPAAQLSSLRSAGTTSLPRFYATSSQATTSAPKGSASLYADIAEMSQKSNSNEEVFAMRTYKPRTPGVRHLRRPVNDHLWKGRPFLPLTFIKKGQAKGGRNSTGRITVRHRGGGHKRRIRTVDFERWTPGKHTVERIEYDPGRTAHIALVNEEATGRKSYILAAAGMRAGDVVESYRAGIPKDLLNSMGGSVDPGILAARTAWRGNCLPLHMIPVGTMVYNVGSSKVRGGVFCRSAGTYAVVISKDTSEDPHKNKWVNVRLQSGEVRRVSKDACATIGVASNPHYQYTQLGKAGRKRWMGIRPTVRGMAMNAADHPHGGGRGKSKGNRQPSSPWGLPAKGGYKTRRRAKTNKWVVIPRVRNHGKRRTK